MTDYKTKLRNTKILADILFSGQATLDDNGEISLVKKLGADEKPAIDTRHRLWFEVSPWDDYESPYYQLHAHESWQCFRIGTCSGVWRAFNKNYEILVIYNQLPGNGHLEDVFEWFYFSCLRDKYGLIFREVFNPDFEQHLVVKRKFKPVDRNGVDFNDLIKTYNQIKAEDKNGKSNNN